jgi:PKD repeat protein
VQLVLQADSGYNFSCGTGTTVTWTFGDGTGGSGLTPVHTYATSGTYHAQATVSNSGGLFTYNQNVQVGSAQPKQCGTLTQQDVALAWTGTGCTESSGTCKSADSITFRPVGNGYDFTCNATHTYDWDFGDNSAHSTLAQPSHSYAGPGTFNVKLLVGNGTSSTTITRSITTSSVGIGGTGCGLMIPDENVYISFFGDGCNAVSGDCSAKSDVAFAVSSSGSYDFNCALHTYSWDFGDGSHSTDKAPSHRYTLDGTYNVKVHVAVGAAAVDLTSTVRVVGADPVIPARHRASGH